MKIKARIKKVKNLTLQKESSIPFYVYNSDRERIPSKSMNVFYNKKMEINRDITTAAIIAFNELYTPKSLIIVDTMAASGIGTIKLLKEYNNKILKIYINDINPLAVKLIKKNLKLNKIHFAQTEVLQEDANFLCLSLAQQTKSNRLRRPNVIILDPFGTPSHFIDATLKLIQKKSGLLCITATDTAVLFGVRKKACIKKYFSKPLHCEYCKEVGARVLVYFISKVANINNLGIIPLLTFYSGHFIKVFALTYKNNEKIYENFSNYGYIIHCNECGYRFLISTNLIEMPNQCPSCGTSEKIEYAGPLWIGKIHNRKFVEECYSHNNNLHYTNKSKTKKILKFVLDEIDMPITYYNIHSLSEKLKLSQIPKINLIIARIKKLGYLASRTHFDFLSIRTNIGIDKLKELLLNIEE